MCTLLYMQTSEAAALTIDGPPWLVTHTWGRAYITEAAAAEWLEATHKQALFTHTGLAEDLSQAIPLMD